MIAKLAESELRSQSLDAAATTFRTRERSGRSSRSDLPDEADGGSLEHDA